MDEIDWKHDKRRNQLARWIHPQKNLPASFSFTVIATTPQMQCYSIPVQFNHDDDPAASAVRLQLELNIYMLDLR